MDKLQTITQVTKAFGISTRTLRYYEQIGLLDSRRTDGYSYRVYDEQSVARLQQIIIFRRLRIPLSQIASLLTDQNVVNAVGIFTKNISELDVEIDSLSTIRDILQRFVDKLRNASGLSLNSSLFSDDALMSLIIPAALSKISIKEEKTMDDLNKANERLGKLTDRDVRIVYLPPATVAAYQYVGDEPEMHCHQTMDKFVLESGLIKIKPDTRHYGFNAPNPVDETGFHGYEVWATIPDDMEVPAPIIKKQFDGGLYAAHMIPFGAFEEWGWLNEWLTGSAKYEYRGDWNNDIMFGWLEENLLFSRNVQTGESEPPDLQLDLLLPIREKGGE